MSLGSFLGDAFSKVGQVVGFVQDPDKAKAQDELGSVKTQQAQTISDQAKKVSAQAANYQSDVDKFKQELPNYVDQQENAAADEGKRQLAQDLSGVDKNASARGLLYSGLHQQGQAQAQGQYQAQQAQQAAQINQQAMEAAQAADEQAIQVNSAAINNAMAGVNAQQGIYDDLYNSALDAKLERQQGFKNFWTAGGMLGGQQAGKATSKDDSSSSSSGGGTGGLM